MADARTQTGIDPNSRFAGNLYNPYNLPTGGYGEDSDPYGSTGAAANLATSSAESNLAAAPDIAKISSLINSLNEAQQQGLNAARLGPQGQQIQSSLLANTQAGAEGQLTPSELRTLQASTAEVTGGRGFGVDNPAGISDFMNRYLKTQYEREQDAAKNYSQLLADNPSAPLFDASNMLVTPGQYSATAAAQANRQIEEQQLAQQAYEFEQKMQAQNDALQAKTGQGMGLNYRGDLVPGGQYSFGYTDLLGRFHPGAMPT